MNKLLIILALAIPFLSTAQSSKTLKSITFRCHYYYTGSWDNSIPPTMTLTYSKAIPNQGFGVINLEKDYITIFQDEPFKLIITSTNRVDFDDKVVMKFVTTRNGEELHVYWTDYDDEKRYDIIEIGSVGVIRYDVEVLEYLFD